ncbi:UPF0158 family protein [Gracilibacillus suaedae]|uniref:UPF0158 family protein n=1 Tax=Gracilibacillus suaedae TaxID=2820273 RepID=UPI001ABEE620|nr:UPF0158 family protein [Gracilibacillus suaedae]
MSKVSLQELVDVLEFNSDEMGFFVNKSSGNVVSVLNEFFRKAENIEEYDDLPEWHQEQIELAIDILEDEEDKYIALPSSFEIDEYEMIENFCLQVKDSQKREVLLDKIKGRGAFRRFKDTISAFGLSQEWYDYRSQCYKEYAIEFCDRFDIDYKD